MWNTIYKILTDAIISLSIMQGTVERITKGKRSKKDYAFLLTQSSSISKHLISVYQAMKVFNNNTQDKMVLLNKWNDDLVGDKIPVSQHAIVEGPFIPIVEKVYNVMDDLIRNGYIVSLFRVQRAFGMYHVGVKTYMGKEMVGKLGVSPEKAYEYISRVASKYGDGICITIGQRHVGVKLKKDIKKGELHIVTHHSFQYSDYPIVTQVTSETSGNS